MGLSDPRPGRRLLDWPADVGALADALGLDRFAVIGFSGGGPYAMACARAIARRLTACGILAGLGPRDFGLRGMMIPTRLMLSIADRVPGLVGRMLWHGFGKAFQIDATAGKALTRMTSLLPEADRLCVERPEMRGVLIASAREAFRQGHTWIGYESGLYCRPWGFHLREIACPRVFLWHGALDRNVPIAMAQRVAQAIPGCHARFYRDEGHFSLPARHMADILLTLTAA